MPVKGWHAFVPVGTLLCAHRISRAVICQKRRESWASATSTLQKNQKMIFEATYPQLDRNPPVL